MDNKTSQSFGDKAGILLRVSSEKQAAEQRTSLATQEAVARARMEQMGIPVVRVYVEPGESGANYHSRPELQQALTDLERGDFNVFVIAFSSRFSRNAEYQHTIRKRVQRARGRFIWCDLGEIDEDDPNSVFVANMKNAVDEFEWGNIRKACMTGRREAAKAGRQPCRTNSPYGYHIVQKNDVIRGTYPPGTEGSYQVIQEEAVHVRSMFAWYAGGASLNQVCVLLWEAGARPRKTGKDCWPRRTVMDMLISSLYRGEASFGKTESRTDDNRVLKGLPVRFIKPAPEGSHTVIPVPAIVDVATWEICQKRRKENQTRLAGAPLLRQMLSGFTFCANCGRRLYFNKSPKPGRAHYYQCLVSSAVHGEPLGGCVSATCYQKEIAERLVVQGVAALATSREVIAAAIEQFTKSLTRDSERDAAETRASVLEKRWQEIKRKQDAAVEAQIQGVKAGIDASAYTPALAILQVELRAVDEELASVRRVVDAPTPNIDSEAVASFVARAMASVETILMSDAIPAYEKNAALRGIVDRVVLHRGVVAPGKRYGQHPSEAHIWLVPLIAGESGFNSRQLSGTLHPRRNPGLQWCDHQH